MSLVTDVAEIQDELKASRADFLRALFLTGYIDVRVLDLSRPGLPPIHTERVSCHDHARVDQIADKHADYNTYVGIAERGTADSGRIENCSRLNTVFSEIDLKDYDGDAVAARRKLDAFPIAPSVIVNSGGGWHAYWLLTEPLDLQNGGAAKAKDLLRRLAIAVGGDLKAAEPARILRLPGTKNNKYDPPRDIVIDSFNEQLIPLSSMEAVLDLFPETGVSAQKKAKVAGTIAEGSRNDLLFKKACSLRRARHTEEEILALLTAMNAERCQPPLPQSEVQQIAQSAMRYEPGQDDFAYNDKGRVIGKHQGNIRLALQKLGLAFRYNAHADKALVTYEGCERPLDDPLLHRAWLLIDEQFGFCPPIDYFTIVVGDLARRRTFHPVKDYLDQLRWDTVPRVDTWLTTYGGAPDNEYIRKVGSIFLIAGVRRVRIPGCKFDEILIAEGLQGGLKSTAFKVLVPDESWFSDDLPLGVGAKETIERTAGKWIVEASELQGYSSREIEALKSFLSRQTDGPVRLAYGRLSVEVPRQFLLCGTTNRLTEYLRDSTGNRRFWPVRVQQFNVEALKRDRDQLWAEAAHREALGESIRLPEALWSAAPVEQEARREIDPWEEMLDSDDVAVDFEADAITVDSLWSALGDAGKFRKQNDAARLSRIVQRKGFTRKKKIDSVCTVAIKKNGVQVGTRTEVKRLWAWIRDGKGPARVEWTRQEREQEPLPF